MIWRLSGNRFLTVNSPSPIFINLAEKPLDMRKTKSNIERCAKQSTRIPRRGAPKFSLNLPYCRWGSAMFRTFFPLFAGNACLSSALPNWGAMSVGHGGDRDSSASGWMRETCARWNSCAPALDGCHLAPFPGHPGPLHSILCAARLARSAARSLGCEFCEEDALP